ncbi:MAG: hypothetical protein V4691_01405 [Pseudomonadota bacterium]
MRGFIKHVLSFLIILSLVTFGRYYYYIQFEKDIYSEVGVALQGVMPKPIKEWGCKRISERFNQAAPECY